MPKKRIDQLLVELNLVPEIEKAKKLIMAAQVLVDEVPIDKPGTLIDEKSEVRILSQKTYVSRGGDKLIAALDHFGVVPKGKVAIDIGSSTGGFTDCLLKEGVKSIFCIDVGTNQLDWKLRNDSRVKVFEGVNARNLDQELSKPLSPVPSLAVIDVSFISATLVLEPLLSFLEKPYQVLLLVKPQFELPKEMVEEGGVVLDTASQLAACDKVKDFAESKGLRVSEPYASPVRGQKKGNQEYFLLINS